MCRKNSHLHVDFTDRTAAISGIAFGKGNWALYLQNGNAVDVCYEVDENVFNDKRSLQMIVQDIKKSN